MNQATAKLPLELYTAAQLRELDRIAIEEHDIPGVSLMERAGISALHVLHANFPEAACIAVLCGTGNNGGDGYVLARHARARGLEVRLLQMGDHRHLQGAALTVARQAWQDGVQCTAFDATQLQGCDLLVDGLLGTGLERPLADQWKQAVEAVNHAGLPVLALDIPTGLNADTGAVMGAAINARITVSFIGLKQGLLTGQGPRHCGRVLYADLDVPASVLSRLPANAGRARPGLLLSRRAATAHKGDCGHVLVVGGSPGYSGAAVLAATAAARSGAGLVSIATPPGQGTGLAGAAPELMIHGVANRAQLEALLARASVVVVGPGMGTEAWGQQMLAAVLGSRLPLVQDADALNLLALDGDQRDLRVLTPHPGEAARLLGCSSTEIQADRFAAAGLLQDRYGGVVVLKGAGTIVHAAGQAPVVCDQGNPGLASGGTGDVLSGVIGGLIAQGMSLPQAAEQAVMLHARAGDLAARAGQRGLQASDLMPWLRRLVNAPW